MRKRYDGQRALNSQLKAVVRSSVHMLLEPVERRLLDQRESESTPPCFILGAPRSGTTLLYELLVTYYEFSYFTNLANMFYLTPLAVSKLANNFKKNWHGNQKSSFGSIKGIGAPSEAGNLWGRWIPEFGYLDEHDAVARKSLLNESVKVIYAMQKLHHAPFINKNVMHGVHIRLLDMAYPGCLFIDLRRDIKANVRSIVRARKKGGGPPLGSDGWWSVRPRNVERWCGLSMEEQACAQVIMLRKDVEDAFASIGQERRIIVNYEDICRQPKLHMELIVDFLKPVCGGLKRRNSFESEIDLSPSSLLSDEAEERVASALATLEMT